MKLTDIEKQNTERELMLFVPEAYQNDVHISIYDHEVYTAYQIDNIHIDFVEDFKNEIKYYGNYFSYEHVDYTQEIRINEDGNEVLIDVPTIHYMIHLFLFDQNDFKNHITFLRKTREHHLIPDWIHRQNNARFFERSSFLLK